MAATSLTDGRSARAARTRDAVVEALLSLLDDGNYRPTARQVAERAGVSLRSVYVHFDDLEDLFTAAAHNHFERVRDLVQAIPGDGPLESRLDAFVRQEIELVFAPELGRRDDAGGERLVMELEVVSNASTWEVLRLQHDLSAEAARDTVARMLRAFLRDA